MTTTESTAPTAPSVRRRPAFWPGGPGQRPDAGVRGDCWPCCRSAWRPHPPQDLDAHGLPVDWPLGGLWVADAPEPEHHEHVPAVLGRGRRHPHPRPRRLLLRDPRTTET